MQKNIDFFFLLFYGLSQIFKWTYCLQVENPDNGEHVNHYWFIIRINLICRKELEFMTVVCVPIQEKLHHSGICTHFNLWMWMETGAHWYNQLLSDCFFALKYIYLSWLIVLILMCPIKLKKIVVANLHMCIIHVLLLWGAGCIPQNLLTVNIETDIAVDCSIINVDTVYMYIWSLHRVLQLS